MTYFPSFFGFAIEQLVNAIETGQTFTLYGVRQMDASFKQRKSLHTPSCKAAAGRRRREMLLVSEIRENFSEVFNHVLEVCFKNAFQSANLPNTLIKLLKKKTLAKEKGRLSPTLSSR